MAGKIAKAAETAPVAAGGRSTLQQYIKKMEGEIAKALPSVITPERFTRIVLSAVSTNPKLAECTPQSFMGAMMTGAQLGMECNTPLGQAYLIPRWNGKKGVNECSFQLGYKGMIDMAYRSGEVSTIAAHVVYENDEFEYELGLEPVLKHKPAKSNRGDPAYVYATFHTKDGGYGFEVMSMEDVREHARKFSDAVKNGKFSPWTTNFEEMAKKGLALDTPIPTPHGWTTMDDLKVGDSVYDMNGKKTKVVAVSDVKNFPCYRITFSDGESIVCDDEHRWVASVGKNAARDIKTVGWVTYTVNELFDFKSSGKAVVVPVTPCIDGECSDALVDPWMLGYWLGNGSSWHGVVTCDTKDKLEILTAINASGYKVGAVKKDPRSNAVSISVLGLKAVLETEGVLRNKHIPAKYLRAAVSYRAALLRGLMDSDGCIEKSRGRAKFCTTNEDFAMSVRELVNSLGEQAHITRSKAFGFGKATMLYTVEWFPRKSVPVTLTRKVTNLRRHKLPAYRSIKAIEKIESVPTKCIAVSSPTKTYLAGPNMVPTHNTVLKRVLKYAPMKTDFARALATDETVKNTISANMFDEPAEYIDITEMNEEPMEDVTEAGDQSGNP